MISWFNVIMMDFHHAAGAGLCACPVFLPNHGMFQGSRGGLPLHVLNTTILFWKDDNSLTVQQGAAVRSSRLFSGGVFVLPHRLLFWYYTPNQPCLRSTFFRRRNFPPLQSKRMNPESAMIRKELLDIIACPKCKGAVRLDAERSGLICPACQVLYEIRDNIPIMLIDAARPLSELV